MPEAFRCCVTAECQGAALCSLGDSGVEGLTTQCVLLPGNNNKSPTGRRRTGR